MISSKIDDNEVKILVNEIFNLVENLALNIEISKQISDIFKKYLFLLRTKPNTAKFRRLRFNLNIDDINK